MPKAPTTPAPPPTQDEFASRLADRRRQLFPNLTAFARHTVAIDPDGKGISRSALLEYERGTYRPGTRELKIICSALRVTPNMLIYGTEQPFGTISASITALNKSTSDASKMPTALVFAALVQYLDDDQRQGHLRMLEDSVKARHTDEEFTSITAAIQAIAEDRTLIRELEDEVDERAEQIFTPQKVEQLQGNAMTIAKAKAQAGKG